MLKVEERMEEGGSVYVYIYVYVCEVVVVLDQREVVLSLAHALLQTHTCKHGSAHTLYFVTHY